MSTANQDHRRPRSSHAVAEDDSVDHLDLVAAEAEAAARRGLLGSTRVPGSVQVEVEPAGARPTPVTPQVFASNARFRPLAMFTVLAACLMVSFGVIAMLAVLQSDGHAAGQHGVEIAPATAIGVAPATIAQRTPCGQVDAQTFSDFNGNGVANVGEGPLEGVTFALRGHGGDLLELASTGADGTIHVDLVVPMLVTIEASSMPEGLWPGPRLAGQLGREVVLAGPDCSVSLGFVWAPADGLVPVAGIAGEELGTVDTAGGVIRSALSPGADGGVQVHGRIWADDLDDRRFTTADEALSGIPITLLDADGEEVAHVLTGTDGQYAFVGMAPHTRYTVSADAGERTLVAGRSLGGLPPDATQASIEFRTGDIGLPVWGVDFMFSPSTAGTRAP